MSKFLSEVSSFRCIHCHVHVLIVPSQSRHRNHCPYCLWSRHLDLYQAGDRLSACRAGMQPVGLTRKLTWKKYSSSTGELMVIHQCTDCAAISINRLAEDDDEEKLLEIFENSLSLDHHQRMKIEAGGVVMLEGGDQSMVSRQLLGDMYRSTSMSSFRCEPLREETISELINPA